MKKIFSLLIMICFVVGLSAQSNSVKTISSTKTYTYNGSNALGDTVIKNATKTYTYFASTLFNTAQFQVTTDTVTGKPKTRVYLYQSPDASNWAYVDSATTKTGGGVALSTKSTVFNPYIQLRVKGIDSTQKTVITKVIGILKVE